MLVAISPACVCKAESINSTPDNHFIVSPDRRVLVSCSRRVGGASLDPGVRSGIVSSTGIGPVEVRATHTIISLLAQTAV